MPTLTGALDAVRYQRHPIFNVEMPTTCPGVPDAVLDPRSTWPDKEAYDAQAKKLAGMFVENFKTFEKHVDPKPPAVAGLHYFGVVQSIYGERTRDWLDFYRNLFGFSVLPEGKYFGVLP